MKYFTPSAELNKRDLAPVLARLVPPTGTVLEVASGSGQHIVYFGQCLPALTWQPSECLPIALESIADWVAASGLANVQPPLRLDVTEHPWPCGRPNAVLAINLIHSTGAEVVAGLLRGASTVLSPGEPLILYGPFYPGTAAANSVPRPIAAEPICPGWGVREIVPFIDDLAAAARAHGLHLVDVIEMPSPHHFCIALRKSASKFDES